MVGGGRQSRLGLSVQSRGTEESEMQNARKRQEVREHESRKYIDDCTFASISSQHNEQQRLSSEITYVPASSRPSFISIVMHAISFITSSTGIRRVMEASRSSAVFREPQDL